MSARPFLFLFAFLVSTPVPADEGVLAALVWHDLVEERNHDPYAVTVDDFRRQLAYLKENDYRPVTLQQCIRAARGTETLPAKAVLLTFDDGLASYATHARPLLAQYGYPSVLSVVTSWVDGKNVPPEYRNKILGWPELKGLARDLGIEIVSHSHDLHRSVLANPQGNYAPAAVTRRYLGSDGRYESDTEYRRRVQTDLQRAQQRLKSELGSALPAITWPYGAWNSAVEQIAQAMGLPVQLTLESWPTRANDLPRIHRRTFHRYRGVAQLEEMLELAPPPPVRFIALDLDRLGMLPPDRREAMLSRLIDRLAMLRATGVVVQPFTADGGAAYFPQRTLPVRADLLGRVLHQIATRNAIRALYVRIPASVPVSRLPTLAVDLARFSQVHGLILAPKLSSQRWQEVLHAVRQERPGLPVGTVERLDGEIGPRTLLVEVEPATADRDLSKVGAPAGETVPPRLFMIRNMPATPPDDLVRAMAALRRFGVRNFGYSFDAVDRDNPPVLDIIDEFKGHVLKES